MKKTILILSSLLLLAAQATQAQYSYFTNNGTITITSYTGFSGFVTIPTNINGLTVTSIGSNAFESKFSLINVTIPNTITNIGDNAFSGCPGLSGVTIGSGVISIGNNAFNGCPALAMGADPGQTLTIPASVVSIGDEAFAGTGIPNVTIPAGVTNLGSNPFAGAFSLGAINVATNNPAYVSVAGVLYNKSQTTLIGYPAGNGVISYTISNGIASIGNDAFAGCSRLANIIIPNSVTSIGDGAFMACTSLTNATIPNSVTNIGAAPFESCTNLTAISLAANNTAYISVAGVLFNQSQTTLIEYPGGEPVGPYTIPNTVTNIGNNAFTDCANLTGVILSSNVADIGANAFNGCRGVTGITLPGSVTFIGDYAFASTSLTNIVIPDGVTNIGFGAFEASYVLTNVNIPNGVTSIAPFAFSLTGLRNITIPATVTNIAYFAFGEVGPMRGVYFEGNAPGVDATSFQADIPTTAYYLPGKSGWGPTFAGLPTALWTPVMQTCGTNFGSQNNQFGFNIAWASNQSVTVHASPSLNVPSWTTLTNVMLTNGSFSFSDANWTNYPARYYRLSYP